MTNHHSDIDQIIRAAASLDERITSGSFREDIEVDEDRAAERLATWEQTCCHGDPAKFQERLSWAGLDAQTAKRILGADPSALDPPPFWVSTMRLMLADLAADRHMTLEIDAAMPDKIPFGAALLPLAAFGMRRLTERVPDDFLAPVRSCLLEMLLKRIAAVCDLALGEEYLRFRVDRGWSPAATPADEPPKRDLYLAFLAALDHGGLMHVFATYPVLPRLAATAIAFWVDDTASFLLRLRDGLPEIARRFFHGEPLPNLQSIQGSLSDPHKRGRTVKIAEFEDGRKIVYKPKSLDIDQAWCELCAWMNARAHGLDLRAPTVWNCGDHGWAEFIEHQPCASLDEVRRFYRRGGMLTALFYAAHATDFHLENLIAAGEHPVPIDLETLFVPDVKVVKGASGLVARRFLGTVLQSLMLPCWLWTQDRKKAYDLSGLGSYIEEVEGTVTLGWVHINTDAMQLTQVKGESMGAQNVPSWPGGAIDAREFVSEIAAGFAEMYRSLMRHRDGLLAEGGPLDAFGGCAARIVYRPTRIYSMLLRRSLTPRLLVNGIQRSLEFEGLTLPLVGQAEAYGGRAILKAEVDALEQLDVPYFEAETGSSAVRANDMTVSLGLLVAPSIEAVATRIRALTAADLEHQIELIESSFDARDSGRSQRALREDAGPCDELAAAELIAQAEAIGDFIGRRVIWDGEAAYWIGLDYQASADKHVLQPLQVTLYNGRSGIAVFFAALHSLTGNEEYRRLALGAARSITIQSFGADADPEIERILATSAGIGGAAGIGSVAYGLLTTGRLLRVPALIEDALRYSRFLSEPEIAADTAFDVIGGAAGAILSLVPLWKETREPATLHQIQASAAHLVKNQQSENGAAGGWNTVDGRPLAGFSHGAAGIAYALFQASEVTGASQFSEAAHRGLAFERSMFVPQWNNWRDARKADTPPDSRPMTAWCHGAPGVGLARIANITHDRNSGMRADIDAAITCIESEPPSPSDHICCGEGGRIEFLLVAGERLHRADLTAAAQRRTAALIARAGRVSPEGRAGFHSNIGSVERPFIPGLFGGLSGIGYQMLRVAAPERLPSVLLWE